MSKSNKPAYADIHSGKFDGTKMSQKELWAADSFTRGAAIEQMDRKHKGDYGYALAKESRAADGAGFSNGERGTASRGARYAGDMARSRAMAYNDAVTGQEERKKLSKDSDSMRSQLGNLRGELSSLKASQASAAPAEKPKGDQVIDSPTRPQMGESSFSQKYLEDGNIARPNIFGGSHTPDAPDNKADNVFDESTTADTPAKDPQAFADQYKLNLINSGATKKPNDEDKPELMPS